jgi:hypothetical protein
LVKELTKNIRRLRHAAADFPVFFTREARGVSLAARWCKNERGCRRVVQGRKISA